MAGIATWGPEDQKEEQKQYESDKIESIYAALIKAQSKFSKISKNKENTYHKSKYADLSDCIESVREILFENDLGVVQTMRSNARGITCLHTRLIHLSGQWIESVIPLTPVKSDPQSLGGYITYMRRYTLNAIIMTASSDDDDDGEGSMDRDGKSNSYKSKKAIPLKIDGIAEIKALMGNDTNIQSKIVKEYGLKNINDLSKEKHQEVKDRVIKYKKALNTKKQEINNQMEGSL